MRYSLICAHLEPSDRIECQTQANDHRTEGCPVLGLGPIAVFPSVDQLRRIRDEIDVWLGAEAIRAEAIRANLGAGI